VLTAWYEDAWDDYLWWQTQDKKTLRRINSLIRDIQRNGYQTTGKPEQLRGDFAGRWSVRINEEHRLVFAIRDDVLVIYQCRKHYEA